MRTNTTRTITQNQNNNEDITVNLQTVVEDNQTQDIMSRINNIRYQPSIQNSNNNTTTSNTTTTTTTTSAPIDNNNNGSNNETPVEIFESKPKIKTTEKDYLQEYQESTREIKRKMEELHLGKSKNDPVRQQQSNNNNNNNNSNSPDNVNENMNNDNNVLPNNFNGADEYQAIIEEAGNIQQNLEQAADVLQVQANMYLNIRDRFFTLYQESRRLTNEYTVYIWTHHSTGLLTGAAVVGIIGIVARTGGFGRIFGFLGFRNPGNYRQILENGVVAVGVDINQLRRHLRFNNLGEAGGTAFIIGYLIRLLRGGPR